MAAAVCSAISQALLDYETLKVVHIRSKKVGLINRLIQMAIIGYIIGYVIIYEKGYQETDVVSGAVTMKLKGIGVTGVQERPPGISQRVWDTADYQIPPQQESAFFVMTNMAITTQRTGYCGENPKVHGSGCNPEQSEGQCVNGTVLNGGNGRLTGGCVQFNGTSFTCQIMSWCPVEDPYLTDPKTFKPILGDFAKDFTVFVKNSIEFKKFEYKNRNIPENENQTFLKNCTYSPTEDRQCPIFKLYDIFTFIYPNTAKDHWEDSTMLGAVIAIDINWDCDLDSLTYKCEPEYSFRRVDNPNINKIESPGYNFRFANYFERLIDGEYVQMRNLTKAYGILFQVNIKGEAGRFNVIPLFLNLGSGLALLSIATIMCDFITLNLLKRRETYRERKYEHVEVEDEVRLPLKLNENHGD